MSSSRLPRVLGFLSLSLLLSFLFFSSPHVYSVAGHVVISEMQVGGTVANDEFVELYNPTNTTVDLSGWRLRRTGGSASNLVASMSGTIPAHGFFLIAHPSYTGSVLADLSYSATSSAITGNSTVTLYQDAGTTVVDRLGIGSVTEFEGAQVASPSAGSSIERKASASSTVSTMAIGGAEEMAGNGEDSENNAGDFLLRAVSQPQNSQSSFEPVAVTPTITPSVTISPTPTITITPSPSPTITITPTQTPTITPTMTPSSTPTSSPTVTPTVTPTTTPTTTPTMTLTTTPTPTATHTPTSSPTVTPSMTSTPTITITTTPTTTVTPTVSIPSPTVTPSTTTTPTTTPVVPSPSVTVTTTPPISLSPFSVQCAVTYHTMNTRWVTITLPRIRCTIVRT